MKLKPENLLWLLVLLPALPFAVSAYLDKVATINDVTDHGSTEYNWLQRSQMDFAPVTNKQYLTECGSCHFAFQPGLLPQRTWQKIMAGLDNHFGDSAELDASLQQGISTYLMANSAENSHYLRSQHINNSIQLNETPARITDTLYFRRKHNGIPEQLVKGNPATGSFSNCNTCHQHAEQGLYNEHDVLIPNTNLTVATM